jgi:ketosteroid isomerase-like protein
MTYEEATVRILLALLLFLICVSGARSQQSKTPSHDVTPAKLVALTNEWTDAINRKDRARLDEFMSPEFARCTWDGKDCTPRSEWLDNLIAHVKIGKNTLTDPAARVYGEFAIVTSIGDWSGWWDGKAFNQRCMVADTWRKIGDQWKVMNRTSDCKDQ